MRIYTNHNGVAVNAISSLSDGKDVEGHHYQILAGAQPMAALDFQRGRVADGVMNGVTTEALLAVLIHRTEFLNGKFPCVENETALVGLRMALTSLEARTTDRIARGVEGQAVA